ncbi:hypothetical protein [Desulfocicer niacini]
MPAKISEKFMNTEGEKPFFRQFTGYNEPQYKGDSKMSDNYVKADTQN